MSKHTEEETLEEIQEENRSAALRVHTMLERSRRESEEEEVEFYSEPRRRGRPSISSEKKTRGHMVYLKPEDREILLTFYEGKTIGKILKRLALEECERIREIVAEHS